MTLRKNHGSRLLTTTALCLLAMPVAAHAQEEGGSGQLEEIVVTAQKRSQNVQKTPLSITAVSAERLEAANIVQIDDLKRIDPALQIGRNSGAVQTFIRGIGNPVTTAGNEASVPIYIDDVYFIRATPAYFDLANVERIEVLKGPQGTLFGRNASGGVISIYTRDPGDETRVSGKVGYGNFDTFTGQFYAGGRLTDTLAADISASGVHQGDGWGKNITTGNDNDRQKYISLRSKVVWEPTSTTRIKLIGYYANSDGDQGILKRPFPGTPGGSPPAAEAHGFPNPGYPATQPYFSGFYESRSNRDERLTVEGYGGSMRIDQEMSFADLVSITAFRRSKETYYSDGDYTAFDLVQYNLDIVDNQLSQEFQLKSKAGSAINWILGAYYLKATQGFNPTSIFGEGPAGLGVASVDITGIQKVRSLAGFGQATFPIAEGTNLTAGLRYTIDRVRGAGKTDLVFFPGVFGADSVTITDQLFDANNACSNILAATFLGGTLNGVCNAPNPDASKTFKKLTWKAALDHEFADDVMGYASYSRGFKTGTFNTLPLQEAALKPEVVDAYEIGVKSELAGRTVRLNVSLFWNDIKDPQVQTSSLGVVRLLNAGKARTRGAEFDSEIVLARGLTGRLSATYLDATFRDFANAPLYYFSSPGVLSVTTADAKGNQMPFASKFKLSGGLNYTGEIADAGEVTFDIGGSYASKFNWDADNVIKEPARFLLDSSIAFTPASMSALTLRLWMKNITGVKYNIGYLPQATGSAYASAAGAPRTYGVEIGFHF